MLFHTFEFAVFLSIMLPLFFLLRGRARRIILLLASWIFYGWSSVYFLGLLIASTVVDFFLALMIDGAQASDRRKQLVSLSVVANLLFLSTFKYYGFFVENFHAAFAAIGVDVQLPLLSFVLPVGISFYTFQSMSYTIDVYRRTISPTRSLVDYALFVSFFPHLVAGPIVRAEKLIPQLTRLALPSSRQFADGVLAFTTGMIYKLYMADNLAPAVDAVFGAANPDGMSVALAVLCFSFQIYGDFAGYSLMALGLAKMLGVELIENFHRPYLAINPIEFWRRWHIALSSWLRDYVYIPLGGSHVGGGRKNFNLLAVMLLCGLWHGAAWHFVAWGGYHGFLLLLAHFLNGRGGILANRFISWLIWMPPICLGWLLFRAESLDQAKHMAWAVLTDFHLSSHWGMSWFAGLLGVYVLPVILTELILEKLDNTYWFDVQNRALRAGSFIVMLLAIGLLGSFTARTFIYFAF